MTGYGVRIPIYAFPGDKKIAGYYYPWDNRYEKIVDYELHHSFKMGGWGIQETIIRDLYKRGCLIVRMLVTYGESRYILYTTFQNYIEHGEVPDPPLNLAYGVQRFLRDEYWKSK